MDIIIEEKTYKGEASVESNSLAVLIEAEMSEALGWDKTMVVNADGIEYTVTEMRSLTRYPLSRIRVEWDMESEVSALEKQLAKKEEELKEAQAEIAEDESRFAAIREAIKSLGEGVPTLTKLIAFLNAVKEAIHYGDGSNDED